MEVATPLALLLGLAVVPALWLARRASGRAVVHPLWFLAAPGPAARARRGVSRRARLLLVVAIALLAAAAAGPALVDRGGARVLIVDLSATRALDLAAVRTRLAGFDDAVLVTPGRGPRRLAARDALAALVPSNQTIDAAALAAAVELALPGARAIEIAAAPAPGDNAGIRAARFHRDPLASRRGRIVVELVLTGSAPVPAAVVARAGASVRARAVPVRAGDQAIAVLPYSGDGGEVLALVLEPSGTDPLAVDDVASVPIPPLAPAAVWVDPTLEGSAVARVLAVLPTVERITAPRADAIAVVASTAWPGPARARLVLGAPPPTAPLEPLLAVAGAPLPGATPALLAAVPPVAVDKLAGARIDPSQVWLRAGPHAALWYEPAAHAPALRLVAALDGAVLPVVLADAFAAPPLAIAAAPATVADVRAPPPAPPVPAGERGRRDGWPTRALLIAAAALIALETIAGRTRGASLLARLALIAGLALLVGRAFAAPAPRVVFVLDVSASVAPAATAARAELARRARVLPAGARAALVVVADGARLAVPLGSPAAIIAWTRRAGADPATLGVDPARTDLGAGLTQAGAALGAPGGAIVLIGDGRDSVRGAAAVREAPALIGRGFALAGIETGDRVRVEVPAGALRAAPGRAFALPIILEARVATVVDVVIAHRGRPIARRSLAVAAGRTAASVATVLADEGPAELDVTVTAADDPVDATDRARIQVEVGGTARVLRIDATGAAALAPAALAGIDALVLDDVPGAALAADAIATVDRFVRDGGTLLWAAGPGVARGGAGGLAALLPLQSRADDPVALMLLVDRSGSIDAAGLRAPVPGPAELAAAAAALGPGDRFGAIAFDVAAIDWLALGPAHDRRQVPALPPAGGGTDPTAALLRAGHLLAAVPPGARRVVVLVSDGGFVAAVGSATEAAAALAARAIRVEVIALDPPGPAEVATLAAVATAGGGRVHDLAAGLAAALPAVRTVAPPPDVAATARARPAWATLLGPVPPALAAGAPVAAHVALQPTADAAVLADAGGDPLLAVRAHGAGRVLAWTTDLRGEWIDRSVATAVIASLARPTRPELDAIAGPVPGTVIVTASGLDDAVPRRVQLELERGPVREAMLIPEAAGIFCTLLANLPEGRHTLSVSGRRTPLLVADREHAGLGIDGEVAALARPGPPPPDDRATRWLVLLGALAIMWVMSLLFHYPSSYPSRDLQRHRRPGQSSGGDQTVV